MKINKVNSTLLAELLMCPTTGLLIATPEVITNIEFESFFNEQTKGRASDLVVLQYIPTEGSDEDNQFSSITRYGIYSKKHKVKVIITEEEEEIKYKPKQLRGHSKLYRNELAKTLSTGIFKRMPFLHFNPVKTVTTESINNTDNNVMVLTSDNRRYIEADTNYYEMDRGFLTIHRT
ncbi:hypothetical protein TSMG0135 [Halocynthia phage JM-2012]|uniref:hypothetical protein n=1 Tax=Halocynthia phage JM-2012 TaxID=1173297 RepID=UPI00025C6963|nr:hypothetical protein TSMG0135 [Halocynthia phage JM-2012]AFI55418.1 hypothetical protein TSMG0135 [Halocynthia phage JM-2012]